MSSEQYIIELSGTSFIKEYFEYADYLVRMGRYRCIGASLMGMQCPLEWKGRFPHSIELGNKPANRLPFFFMNLCESEDDMIEVFNIVRNFEVDIVSHNAWIPKKDVKGYGDVPYIQFYVSVDYDKDNRDKLKLLLKWLYNKDKDMYVSVSKGTTEYKKCIETEDIVE